MAQHAQVPKFWNWEGAGNVPYTQDFDNARRARRGGELINPNVPQPNPDSFPQGIAAAGASLRNTSDPEISKHEQHTSREDGDLHQSTDFPARHDVVSCKPGTDAAHQRTEESMTSNDRRRTNRTSGGSERSTDCSALHPLHQVKSATKGGVSSPSREKKGSSEAGHGFAPTPSTPGRSKLRAADRGDQAADRHSTVPKFGDWDEKNPSSSDSYTDIFNKVRQEKHAKAPIIKTDPVYDSGHGQDGGNFDSSSCSCFGWCRK
uniref:RPM1-interacting protein 4 n=1 Tax=Anthurium amnicola TaxID=1678845 RepID=A0A1D1Z2P7_9ARAE